MYEGCGFDVGHVSTRAISSRDGLPLEVANGKVSKLMNAMFGLMHMQIRCTAGQVGTAAHADLSMNGILPGCMSLVTICNYTKESIARVGAAFLI